MDWAEAVTASSEEARYVLLVEVTWLSTCVGRPVAETDDELMELQFSEAKATLEEESLVLGVGKLQSDDLEEARHWCL
jgi:hypothetical protein